MTRKLSMMDALKRAVSPLRPCRTNTDDAGPSSAPGDTSSSAPAVASLTDFVLDRLQGPSKELFALSFAAQMSVDKDALVFNLADALPWLGIDRIDSAVRLLTRHFREGEYRVESAFHRDVENPKGGRPGKRYLISLDMFEDLLMLADTKQGREARKMYKQLRDAVQDYMKMEVEISAKRAQQQLQEQTSKLAIEEAKRLELETTHAELHAKLDAERERRSAMKALRDAEDEPRQTAYLMESGMHRSYVKIGKTGEEGGEKRKKELQTGNPEVITVLFEIKCLDSKLVERNLHHIFRWYKRRGEWYEIDKERAIYVTRMVVSLLDGLRRVEHDTTNIVEACQNILIKHQLEAPSTTDCWGTDEWREFRERYILPRPGRCQWTDVYDSLNEWLGNKARKTHRDTTKNYFVKHLGPIPTNSVSDPAGGRPFRGWNNWHLEYHRNEQRRV